MAFRFKRKEPVATAVRRLGLQRIEHAIASLRIPVRAEAIHGARKDIKKIRALLRLVRARIAKKKYHRQAARLRKTAAQFGAARDAYIKTQTLQDLAGHFEGQLPPGTLRQLEGRLRKNREEEMTRLKKETVRKVRRRLRRAAKELKHLKVDGKEWNALGPGLKISYRAGRRAGRAVLQDPSNA